MRSRHSRVGCAAVVMSSSWLKRKRAKVSPLSLALNASTRGALSLLRGGGNRSGADAVATWQTGFPLGIDFSRGYPRYSPWSGSAFSRISRGEIDAMLIVGHIAALPVALLAAMRS